MTNQTICRAILQGRTITIWSGQNEHRATFAVSASKSLRKRIAQWEQTNNCLVENYTGGMLGTYRETQCHHH